MVFKIIKGLGICILIASLIISLGIIGHEDFEMEARNDPEYEGTSLTYEALMSRIKMTLIFFLIGTSLTLIGYLGYDIGIFKRFTKDEIHDYTEFRSPELRETTDLLLSRDTVSKENLIGQILNTNYNVHKLTDYRTIKPIWVIALNTEIMWAGRTEELEGIKIKRQLI